MNKLNTQIYDEASEWMILHRSDDLDTGAKQRFDAWLRESPQHLRAYLEMSTIWEDVPTLNHDWNPSADELIARAREDMNVFPLDLKGAGVVGFGSIATVPQASAERLPLEALKGLEPLESRRTSSAVEQSTPAVEVPAELIEASAEPPLQAVPAVTVSASQHTAAKLLAFAAILLMAVGSGWFFTTRGLYTTDTGEQLTIALNDGSTVQLNAQSRLRVHYTDQERSIDLIQGQALFKVAKDPNRPFIVRADGTRVRAVGTEFDVYKKTTGTQVTVVEGRVAILTRPTPKANTVPGSGDSGILGLSRPGSAEDVPNANASSRGRGGDTARASPQHARNDSARAPASHALQTQLGEVLLSAGEQILIAEADRAPELAAPGSNVGAVPTTDASRRLAPAKAGAQVQPANLEAATAWTQQRLVFDFTPLTEVAQEFNRYNRRPLIIDDPTLDTFNISGSFSSTDPALLLRFLRDQPGIVVNETADEIHISRQAAATNG
jgi:transmembrane sensor